MSRTVWVEALGALLAPVHVQQVYVALRDFATSCRSIPALAPLDGEPKGNRTPLLRQSCLTSIVAYGRVE